MRLHPKSTVYMVSLKSVAIFPSNLWSSPLHQSGFYLSGFWVNLKRSKGKKEQRGENKKRHRLIFGLLGTFYIDHGSFYAGLMMEWLELFFTKLISNRIVLKSIFYIYHRGSCRISYLGFLMRTDCGFQDFERFFFIWIKWFLF